MGSATAARRVKIFESNFIGMSPVKILVVVGGMLAIWRITQQDGSGAALKSRYRQWKPALICEGNNFCWSDERAFHLRGGLGPCCIINSLSRNNFKTLHLMFQIKPRKVSKEELREDLSHLNLSPEELDGSDTLKSLLEMESKFHLSDKQAVEALLACTDEETILDALKPENRVTYITNTITSALGVVADRRAERHGFLWTPLLDHVGLKGGGGRKEEIAGKKIYLTGVPENLRRSQIRSWIQKAERPDDLNVLLHYKSRSLWELVATHSEHWDGKLLAHLFEAQDLLPALAANPHCGAEAEQWLINWSFSELEAINEDSFVWNDNGNYAWDVISTLRYRGVELPRERLKKLTFQVAAIIAKGMGERSHIGGFVKRSWDELFALNLDVETLKALSDKVSSETELVMELIRHPTANVDLWTHILDNTRSRIVRAEIAGLKTAQRSPEIHEKLGTSKDTQVIGELLESANLETDILNKYLSVLAEKEPRETVGRLKKWPQEKLGKVKAETLKPLLSHPNRNLRLGAIELISELEQSHIKGETERATTRMR